MKGYAHITVIVVMLLFGCGGQERITPTLTFHNGNALLPTVEFSTRENGNFVVLYWPMSHPEAIQESQPSSGNDHRIVLFNVKAATQYQYAIRNAKTGKQSDPVPFMTRKLPDEVTHVEKQLTDSTLFQGFVLIRGLAPKGSDLIIDSKGDVVWYHLYDTAVRRPFIWTDHQSILSVYDSSQLMEVDLYGNRLLDMRLEDYGVLNMLHHEALYNAAGNIVALTHDSVRMELSKVGHPGEHYLRADGIIVLSPAGKKVWEWNLLDVYDPRDYPDRKVALGQSLGHANSIAIAPDGNYVVSFRDFSQLWKINATDGTVMWKLGKGGDFAITEEGYFLRQHSVLFTSDGELMLFDNGERKVRPNSRILGFRLNEVSKQATITTNITLSTELSADKMCSAERIGDDRYLVCTSKRNGVITIVDDQAAVHWRVNLSRPSYRAYYLADPFGSHHDVQ